MLPPWKMYTPKMHPNQPAAQASNAGNGQGRRCIQPGGTGITLISVAKLASRCASVCGPARAPSVELRPEGPACRPIKAGAGQRSDGSADSTGSRMASRRSCGGRTFTAAGGTVVLTA
jgi:hypothetical protein